MADGNFAFYTHSHIPGMHENIVSGENEKEIQRKTEQFLPKIPDCMDRRIMSNISKCLGTKSRALPMQDYNNLLHKNGYPMTPTEKFMLNFN